MEKSKITEIREAYESGKYDLVSSLFSELPTDGSLSKADTRTAIMYSAVAMLNLEPDLSDKERCNKGFKTGAVAALEMSESWQEYYEVYNYIEEEFYKWAFKAKCKVLNRFVNNISGDTWDKVIHLTVEYLVYFGSLSVSVLSTRKALEEKEGLDSSAASEKYHKEPHDYTRDFTDEIFKEASEAFERSMEYFEYNRSGSPDAMKSAARTHLGNFIYLAGAVRYTIPTEEDEKDFYDTAVLVERLEKHAEILDYLLSAVIVVNGNPMSLIAGDPRTDYYRELKGIYSRIERLSPGYVAPELPSLSALEYKPSSSGGGCYVATAVYGSYDCPQVWTLRRYRDYTLAETWYGRAFIRTYYAISPTLVKWFGETDWFKNMWRGKLDRMVAELRSQGVDDSPYEDRSW